MIEEYLSEIEKCGNNAKMVYDHMQDDESRKIFTLKCQDLLESRGIEPWIKGILSILR